MKRRKVLLVNDMLNDFLEPRGVLYCGKSARKIIPYVAKKIEEFHRKGDPVVFICDAHRPSDYELRIYPPHAMKGTYGSRLLEEMPARKTDFVVEKLFYDGFSNPLLEKILKRLKANEVYLAGVCTSICVMETVSALYHKKIPTFIYKRGVADFDSRNHRFALDRMKRIFGAHILS